MGARKSLAALFAFVSAALVISLTLFLIHAFYGPRSDSADVKFITFAPEPVERAQFLAALLLTPVLLLLGYLGFRRLTSGMTETAAGTAAGRAETAVALGLLALLAAGLIRSGGFFASVGEGWARPWQALPMTAAAAGGLLTWMLVRRADRYPAAAGFERAAAVGGKTFALTLVGLVALYSVIGLRNIDLNPIYTFSFGAVFEAMVQVYLGRELLVDHPTLYGLYPHLLVPFFKTVGLSVIKFSLLMAFMNASSILMLAGYVRRLVSRRSLAWLTVVAVIMTYFDYRIEFFDLFFQCHPLRFFFPALSLLLAMTWFRRGGRMLYLAGFLIGSVAVLWNTDTGLTVLLAWIIVLVYKEMETLSLRRAAVHLLAGGATLAAVIGCFSLAMLLGYGVLPDYAKLFHYQKLYYGQGYSMLPMSAIHPWNMVALTYAAGMLYALKRLVERRVTPAVLSVFHLAVLGSGLFTYFQGRSTDANLVFAGYPAVILAAFFADRFLVDIKASGRAGRRLLVSAFGAALAFAAVQMAVVTPAVTRVVLNRWRVMLGGGETPVMSAARFLKENTSPGEEVVILSLLSSIYHLESRTLPPRGSVCFGQGVGSDERKAKTMLSTMKAHSKIFVAGDIDLKPVLEVMREEFDLKAVTTDGYMFLFAPSVYHPRAATDSGPDLSESLEQDFRIASAYMHFRQAELLGMKGDLTGQAEHLVKAIGLDPYVEAESFLKLGRALNLLGRASEAVAYLEKAASTSPDNAFVRYDLGLSLELLGRNAEARDQFEAAVRLAGAEGGDRRSSPEFSSWFADARDSLAGSLVELGLLDEAEHQVREALRLKPGMAGAHYNLGRILSRRGRRAEAEKQYLEAVAADPGYAEAYNNLGMLLAEMGRVAESVGRFEKALELKPDSQKARYNLGLALAMLGRSEEAEMNLREAVRLNPQDVEALNNLGVVLAGLGRAEEAAGFFNEALRLNPGHGEAGMNLIKLKGRSRE